MCKYDAILYKGLEHPRNLVSARDIGTNAQWLLRMDDRSWLCLIMSDGHGPAMYRLSLDFLCPRISFVLLRAHLTRNLASEMLPQLTFIPWLGLSLILISSSSGVKLWFMDLVLVYLLRMVFLFSNGSKKIKRITFCDKKIIWNWHFGFSKSRFIWMLPCLFTYTLSMAVFALSW